MPVREQRPDAKGRSKGVWLGAAIAVALVLVAVVMGMRTGRAPAAPAGPGGLRPQIGTVADVDQSDVADPAILTVTAPRRTTYYRFGTTDWQSNVPTAVSSDLHHWAAIPDALPVLPSWAAPSISMTWAPAALRDGSIYLLYFTTEDRASGLQCVGRATAVQPQGPYRDSSSAPMLCQRQAGGSIDPSVTADGSGGHVLLWKNDGNSHGQADALWSQPLSANGLSLRGEPHRLLGADEAWQQNVIEGPAMVPDSQGGFWLFYSGGNWHSDTYQTGLAWCRTVTGPCQETADRPWLATTATMLSPGGLEVFGDARGRPWVALSSFVLIPSRRHPGHFYDNRVLDVAPLTVH
ncbi:MAG: glycoside hydrolase family 43 protein [Actinomycetota bacterium]|nr:glycoside hydrolase family 43 protein [Actinomycetota bacterium]